MTRDCVPVVEISPQRTGDTGNFRDEVFDEFEARFAEMVPHYPTKRSALVPTLLYAQDEVGYLSDEVIAESLRGWT